jgi:energy-coupling factor transporter ATP-binding protein EcfA2
MKLLGLEFRGIAGYERQFISFENNINLITGRNNIGKSAMLKSSTVLASLPINSPGRKIATPLIRGYESFGGNFQFSIICLIDSPHDPVLDRDKDRWSTLITSKTIRLRYDFSVHLSGVILFDGVTALLADREAPIARIAEGGRAFERIWYKTPLWIATDKMLQTIGGAVLDNNRVAGMFAHDDLFGPLMAFANVRLVDAHRVFRDFLELRTVSDLKGEAEELGPYLQWLQGDNPRKFNQIQSFVTSLFPEFEFLNIESVDDRVTIRFTQRRGNSKIPLSRCGTGVEQVLALATFVVASAEGTIMLLDEPHSFLHPTAERLLLEFLFSNPQHKYVITTHSAIFINAVSASHITHLTGKGYAMEARTQYSTTQLLFDLGYRNSDLLFSDQVIFVEGDSDQEILPILLRKAGVNLTELAKTGFCRMKGSGDIHTVTRQSEDLLSVLHKEGIKRLYLFDGDQKPKEDYIKKIRHSRTGESIPLAFLPRPEIENYLLDSEAIAKAINEVQMGATDQTSPLEVTVDQVNKWLQTAIKTNEKGSDILKDVYSHAGLRFKKTSDGRVIALHTGLETNSALKELAGTFSSLFS